MSHVRVSDIALYIRCPRILYFVSKGHSLEERGDPVEKIFWREVFSRYSLQPREIDIFEVIETILETHPYLSEEDLERFRSLRIQSSTSSEDPYEVEVELSSERLRMCGVLDKIVFSEEPVPVILRISRPPTKGVYRSDRMRLTAYAMLAEERFGRIRGGYVDYAPYGVIREHRIRFEDRKRVLKIRDKIFSIYRGRIPPKKENCSGCEFSELCEVEGSFLSDLLF